MSHCWAAVSLFLCRIFKVSRSSFKTPLDHWSGVDPPARSMGSLVHLVSLSKYGCRKHGLRQLVHLQTVNASKECRRACTAAVDSAFFTRGHEFAHVVKQTTSDPSQVSACCHLPLVSAHCCLAVLPRSALLLEAVEAVSSVHLAQGHGHWDCGSFKQEIPCLCDLQ